MSETQDSNTNWQQNEHGDVVPDYQDKNAPHFPGYERNIPHDKYSSPTDVSVIEQKLANGEPISQEEARLLNQEAEAERGGSPVDPNTLS